MSMCKNIGNVWFFEIQDNGSTMVNLDVPSEKALKHLISVSKNHCGIHLQIIMNFCQDLRCQDHQKYFIWNLIVTKMHRLADQFQLIESGRIPHFKLAK